MNFLTLRLSPYLVLLLSSSEDLLLLDYEKASGWLRNLIWGRATLVCQLVGFRQVTLIVLKVWYHASSISNTQEVSQMQILGLLGALLNKTVWGGAQPCLTSSLNDSCWILTSEEQYFLKKFFFFFSNLAVPGLNCGRKDLPSSLGHAGYLVGARSLSCGMWDPVPWPGIEPRPHALGAQSISHWTTREVPEEYCFKAMILNLGCTVQPSKELLKNTVVKSLLPSHPHADWIGLEWNQLQGSSNLLLVTLTHGWSRGPQI